MFFSVGPTPISAGPKPISVGSNPFPADFNFTVARFFRLFLSKMARFQLFSRIFIRVFMIFIVKKDKY